MVKKAKLSKNIVITFLCIVGILYVTQLIITLNTNTVFPKTIYVKRVIDGDTCIDSKNKRYRFIGIDTPELGRNKKPDEPYAREASEFTKRLIEKKRIKIEFDKDKFDRFNRYLVYIYTPDGEMLNKLLLAEGLADVYRKQPFKYKSEFYNIEKQARQNRKGIWK